MGLLDKLFGTRRPIEAVSDPVLGMLRYDGDVDGWSSTVAIAADYRHGGDIEFTIGGGSLPDERGLEEARRIVCNYARFDDAVCRFLDAQRCDLEEAAAEIANLRVQSINLWSGAHGMIYFAGGSEALVWRCDYVGGELRDLGCDT